MTDSDQLAKACAEKLFVRDQASRTNGIELIVARAGHTEMKMRVRPEMANALGIGHGGLTFLLADAAFSYACNSDNRFAVASGGRIEFLKPAKIGDELTAVCTVLVQRAKMGVYDAIITNQNNDTIALFRGNAYKTGDKIIPELEDDAS